MKGIADQRANTVRDSEGEYAPPLRPRLFPAVDVSNQPKKLYPLRVGSGKTSAEPVLKVAEVGETVPLIGL